MRNMQVNHFQSNKPSIRLSAGQWVSQSILINPSVPPSIYLSIRESGHSVSQAVHQLISQSLSHSVSQSVMLSSYKRKLTKYNNLHTRHTSTKHIFRLTRDHTLILKAGFNYLKQFICMLKSALVVVFCTLQVPCDFWSGISGCRDIDWQLGAFSDGHGWRNLRRKTRWSCTCWKMIILRTQTPLIRTP